MSEQPFQLPLLDLPEELRRFRAKHGYSQHEIAQRVGTTQVTISRYERGAAVSGVTESKIRDLLVQEIRKTGGFSFTMEVQEIERWQLGIFRYPSERSGDSVRTYPSEAQQIPILYCDATGADVAAARTAELLEVACGAAVGALGDLPITPNALFRGIDASIRFTRTYWTEAPSLHVLLLERTAGVLSVLNAGMPVGYLFRGAEGATIPIATSKISPPGMQRVRQSGPVHETHRVDSEDFVFLCSDGFRSELERATSYKLEAQLRSVGRALKSDVKSIGPKLLRTLEANVEPATVRDNLSFLILRRR